LSILVDVLLLIIMIVFNTFVPLFPSFGLYRSDRPIIGDHFWDNFHDKRFTFLSWTIRRLHQKC